MSLGELQHKWESVSQPNYESVLINANGLDVIVSGSPTPATALLDPLLPPPSRNYCEVAVIILMPTRYFIYHQHHLEESSRSRHWQAAQSAVDQ